MATLTVSDTNPRVQYTATSSQTVFAYAFPIFADADLKVYQDTTLLTLTTDYTVSGAASSSGGNVTLGTGATTGDIITIYRDLAVSRSSDYQTGGDLLAETLNDDLDKLVMMVQQSEFDVSNRSIRFGQFVTGLPLNEITDNATDRANKVIGFDSSGQPIATTEIGNYQGDWATSTAYVTRDIIKDTSNNNIYLCNESHTSSGSQPISGNADSAKWDLLVDASSAATSATAAATSATSSASSATSSASSATSSASSATTATTKASEASTSATAAASSATSAASSATSAAASFDSFDDVYLGEKSSAPTLDNDSDALQAGALYFNSSTNALNVYSGSSWSAIAADTDVKVLVSSNDTTAGYLNGKLVAGSNVTFTENNDGSDETLTIAASQLSLTAAHEWTAQQNFNNTALTFDATQDWALTANQVATLTLTNNTTFDAPTQMVDGAFYSLIIIQDGTGSRTASWNAVFKWAGGTAPTLTTTASAKDVFVWRSDGTNMYEVGRQLNVS
jgi:hypothetical protein